MARYSGFVRCIPSGTPRQSSAMAECQHTNGTDSHSRIMYVSWLSRSTIGIVQSVQNDHKCRAQIGHTSCNEYQLPRLTARRRSCKHDSKTCYSSRPHLGSCRRSGCGPRRKHTSTQNQRPATGSQPAIWRIPVAIFRHPPRTHGGCLRGCLRPHSRKRISSKNELNPILEQITKSGKPLLIISEDVGGEA